MYTALNIAVVVFFGIVPELFVSVMFVTHWKSFDHIFIESICFSFIITYKIGKILQLFVLQCVVYVEYFALSICLCVKYFEKHLDEKHLFHLCSAERFSGAAGRNYHTRFPWLFWRFIFFAFVCLPLIPLSELSLLRTIRIWHNSGIKPKWMRK